MTTQYVGSRHTIILHDIKWPEGGWQGPTLFIADIDDYDIDVTDPDELTGAAYDQLLETFEQPGDTSVGGFSWVEVEVVEGFMQFHMGYDVDEAFEAKKKAEAEGQPILN